MLASHTVLWWCLKSIDGAESMHTNTRCTKIIMTCYSEWLYYKQSQLILCHKFKRECVTFYQLVYYSVVTHSKYTTILSAVYADIYIIIIVLSCTLWLHRWAIYILNTRGCVSTNIDFNSTRIPVPLQCVIVVILSTHEKQQCCKQQM